MIKLNADLAYNTNAYDTEIREVYVKLPSGRKLYFSPMPVYEWQSDEETNKQVEEYKAELASMLAELGVSVE